MVGPIAVKIPVAAQMYGISADVVRTAIYSGALAARKVGAHWSVRVEDLDRWYRALPTA